jgi:hypothetical protein
VVTCGRSKCCCMYDRGGPLGSQVSELSQPRIQQLSWASSSEANAGQLPTVVISFGREKSLNIFRGSESACAGGAEAQAGASLQSFEGYEVAVPLVSRARRSFPESRDAVESQLASAVQTKGLRSFISAGLSSQHGFPVIRSCAPYGTLRVPAPDPARPST